jgi:hypothetical protein
MPRPFLVILLLLVRISSAQTNSLSFRPVAAEYSIALDRIVMISANPNQLHIYDPVSQSDTKVSLPVIPLSLSVSPDGLHAAVAHDLLVSYVNLSTAAVEKTFTTAITGAAVVLGTDWLYLLPGSSTPLASIKIVTGAETDLNIFYASSARLHPSGKAIYGTLNGTNGFGPRARPGLLSQRSIRSTAGSSRTPRSSPRESAVPSAPSSPMIAMSFST